MESNLQVVDRIIALSYITHDSLEIVQAIKAEMGVEVSTQYVDQTIADFVAAAYEDRDYADFDQYDRYDEDRGFDPYMCVYTDDC